MRKTKGMRLCSVLLACLLLFALFPLSPSAAHILSVDPYGDGREEIDAIGIGGTLTLFLPVDTDPARMKIRADGDLRIGGVRASDAAALIAGGGSFPLSGSGEGTLNVLCSSALPALYLTTESGSMNAVHADKSHREACRVTVYENGSPVLDSSSASINGRGNSTWKEECLKKPYNLHFETKTSVLGMPAAKKWTLLASWKDESLLRDALAWEIGDLLGLPYSSEYRFVDLYANGEYLGNYLLCESVGVGKDRVPLYDLEEATQRVNSLPLSSYPAESIGIGEVFGALEGVKSRKWIGIPNDPADLSGGYLLEAERGDRYAEEDCGFVTRRGQCVVVKAPQYASKAQTDFIASLWQDAEDALCSVDGYNGKGKHYTDYFDMDTVASMYILNELSGNLDAGLTSNYFFLQPGGKLTAAPLWDFDLAFGTPTVRLGVSAGDPAVWFANRLCYNYRDYERSVIGGENPSLFTRLYRREEFRALVYEKWASLSSVLAGTRLPSFLDSLADAVGASALMNGVRWGFYYSTESYRKQVEEVKTYLAARREWLDRGFSEDAAQIWYDLNGGWGWVADCRIYAIGDEAVVLPFMQNDLVNNPPEGLTFSGWNTERDGSGETYLPGETLTLPAVFTLYAQWRDEEGKLILLSEPEEYYEPHLPVPSRTENGTGTESEDTGGTGKKQGFFARLWENIKAFFRRIAELFTGKKNEKG